MGFVHLQLLLLYALSLLLLLFLSSSCTSLPFHPLQKAEKDPANFLKEAIMEEASEEAQQAYTEAQSRASDVEVLMRSIADVAQMFNDLAILINKQSEMLDSIEQNIVRAGEYVKKGNDELRKGIEMQKKTRKCYCCMIVILIVIICVLIAGLGSYFGGVFKKA